MRYKPNLFSILVIALGLVPIAASVYFVISGVAYSGGSPRGGHSNSWVAELADNPSRFWSAVLIWFGIGCGLIYMGISAGVEKSSKPWGKSKW